MKIKVTYEMQDKIVSKVLLNSIKLCVESINHLLAKDELETYQKIDLADDLVYLKALKTVYSYYNIDISKANKHVVR